MRRRGETISVDLGLFVLLYNTNLMNELKFNDKKNLNPKNTLTVQIFYNLLIHPIKRKGWST